MACFPPRIAIVGVGRKEMTDEAYRDVREAKASRGSRGGRSTKPLAGVRPVAVLRQRRPRRAERASRRSARASTHRARARPARQSHLLPGGAAVAVRADRRAARPRALRRPAGPPPVSRGSSSRSRSAATSRAPGPSTTRSPTVFDERQIFRIDHYLGKETVQNILVLRFANSFFEPLFNQKYVDHVQITVAEEEGVGTRAGYYEQAGALRDMVQNHLLQLLALVAMEPPYSLDADVVRDEKLEVLQSLRPIEGDGGRRATSSARSTRPGIDVGTPVPGYRDEPGVAPQSRTETFVALQVFIDNWRWAGVPVLPAHRQAPAETGQRDLGPPQDGAADPVQRRPGGAARAERADASAFSPTKGSRSASPRRCRARRPHLPGQDGLRLRQHLRRDVAGGVRAAAARRDGRRRDALHAPGRRRGGVALGDADPRTLGGQRRRRCRRTRPAIGDRSKPIG